MPIEHWLPDGSANPEWLSESRAMENEGKLSPGAMQSNFSRIVSRDAVRGEAPLEVEAVPA